MIFENSFFIPRWPLFIPLVIGHCVIGHCIRNSFSVHKRFVMRKLPQFPHHLVMFIPFLGLGFSGIVYAIIGPLVIIQIFALLFIPSLLSASARPFAVGKAVYCYLLQAVGIVLMSLGGLPALYAVTERLTTGTERFTAEIYLALLILFAAGGFTFLWHESMSSRIEPMSRRVVQTVFWFGFKLAGYVLMLVSALSFFLTMLLMRELFMQTGWIMPLILFLYGSLLAYCTRMPPSVPQDAAPPASHSKKLIARKVGKKK